ncbi:MAG: hypothetical protein U0W24_00600 [Bacteroidales bacterium]
MSKENFESKKSEIGAIPDSLANYPGIPVDVALQEAEDLLVWCQPDKELLVKAGLDWKLVEDLNARIGACRYLQSQWLKDYRSLEQVQVEWNQKSPLAYDLRNELLHHFYFAYAKLPDLYNRTQKIAEGNTHADMIQDLSDLSALGQAFPDPLKAIGFDMSLLEKAAATSEEMALLLANANGKKMEDNKMRLLRDKAFTYMKEVVDEIRRCGQYVFWKDEQKRKGYASRFYKSKNQSKQKNVKLKEETGK